MTQEVLKVFEAVSKVILSAPKALQKTGLDLVNFRPLHTPWELSSLKCGNVHVRKDNAARLERVRPRGKFEW
jgi:hypothetical protein